MKNSFPPDLSSSSSLVGCPPVAEAVAAHLASYLAVVPSRPLPGDVKETILE